MIRGIFLPLDRKYTGTNGILSIWDLGLLIYREMVCFKPNILELTVKSTLDQIEKERHNESINRSCMRSLIRMYILIDRYEVIESAILEDTIIFYKEERDQSICNFDPIYYIDKVKKRISEENSRTDTYLKDTSRAALLKIIDDIYLRDVIDIILDKSLSSLMEEGKQSYIGELYVLFSRIERLDKMKLAWKEYIKQAGLAIMEDQELSLIDSIIDFKSKMNSILVNQLGSNDQFTFAMKEAFEFFINSKKDVPSELLAKYVDKSLRSRGKATSDFELEGLLDNVMQIFRYIHGKDFFEAFYKKDLAKRLLLHKSISEDAEKSMIMRLRTECGSDFTQKLEGMFKDVEVSSELTAGFKASKFFADNEKLIDMDVYVLTTSFWPQYQPVDLILPQELAQAQNLFSKYYMEKHSGRSLVWLNGQGLCSLRARYAKSNKELHMSTCQAVVLLLFNDSTSLRYSDLKTGSGISDDDELKRTVLSLWKHKLILKEEGSSKSISDDTVFKVNDGFKSKQFRIVVNQIQIKETKQEQVKTHENIILDRQYQIDAAIVRIMKARKTLNHNELIVELYNQLKFPTQVCITSPSLLLIANFIY